MNTFEQPSHPRGGPHLPGNPPEPTRSWFFTRDHKRLAILYLVGLMLVVTAGAFLGLAMRSDLATPDSELGPTTYLRLFTSHGMLMLFVFAIPAISATLGNFVLPLMIGARGMAFPRLGLAAFYLWVAGALLTMLALTLGALDTGWAFDATYSRNESHAEVVAALGVLLIAVSVLLTALGFVVTIHKMRAPGVTLWRLPVFVKALYATSIVQLVAAPLLSLTAMLVVLDKVLGVGLFDPQLGGDPVLFQHFFWASVHPLIISTLIAALGVTAEVISVHARHGVSQRAFVAAISVLAVASLFQWGEHMAVSGQSELATTMFSFMALIGAVPLFVIVASLVHSLRRGVLSLTTPAIFGLGVVLMVAFGAIARVPQVAASTATHLQGTAYSVGQLHAALAGGLTLALLAGFFHWFPKLSGRHYHEQPGRLGAVVTLFGVLLMAAAELLLGARGMPRQGVSYEPEYQILQMVAGGGGLLFFVGLVWSVGVLVLALFKGRSAEENPWRAHSLEWSTTSPPPLGNFVATPHVDRGPYVFDEGPAPIG